MKNSKKAQETAETRMAIIAPLLAPGLDKDSVRNLRKTLVETSHVSQRTLDRYEISISCSKGQCSKKAEGTFATGL
jgi:hypothetical protein